MPYARRSRRRFGGRRVKFAKRTPARRRYGRVRRFSTNRPALGSGFPASKIVRLRYCETVNMSASSNGTIAVQNFKANGMYDTNATGSGHQPSGFNTWETLYNHYTVLGAKITMRVVAASVNNYLAPVIVGVKLTDDGTPSTTMNAILEQGMCSYRLFNAQANSNPVVLRKGFSLKKFFGVKDAKDVRDRFGAGVGGDPSDICYFTIFCGTAGGLTMTDSKTVTVDVTIDYIAQFTEPKDLEENN